MHIAQVGDDMLIDYSAEQKDLFHRVWSLLLDQRRVGFVAEEDETLHLTNVLHALILLHQVVSHSLLDHVTSSHISSNGSLQHHSVALDSVEYLAEPSTSKVGLNP